MFDDIIVITAVAFLLFYLIFTISKSSKEIVFLSILLVYHFSFRLIYKFVQPESKDALFFFNNGKGIDSIFELTFLDAGISVMSNLSFLISNFVFDLNFETTNIFFSGIGFISLLILFTECRKIESIGTINIFSIPLVYILLLCPSIHFWTCVISKESICLLGLLLILKAISRLDNIVNYLLLFLGIGIVSMIRIHLGFFVLSSGILVLLMLSKVSLLKKTLGFLFSLTILLFGLQHYLHVHFDESELSDIFNIFNTSSIFNPHYSALNSNTGIPIDQYNIFQKIFTFLFRPMLETVEFKWFIMSIENMGFIILVLSLFRKGIKDVLCSINSQALFSLVFIIIYTVLMSNVAGNFGLISRYKIFIYTPFIFFVLWFHSRRQIINSPLKRETQTSLL